MMFSISELRRRGSQASTNSRLGRMQSRLHSSNTTDQAVQGHTRGRSEGGSMFSVSGTRRAMSASVFERARSVDGSRVLPEPTSRDFSCDQQLDSNTTVKYGESSLRVKLSHHFLTRRPALASTSATHIANQLNWSHLPTDKSAPSTTYNSTPATTTMEAFYTNESLTAGEIVQSEASPRSAASANLKQLVQDTASAFDAVSSALAEMKAVRASYSSAESQPPAPPPKDPARPLPPRSAKLPIGPPPVPRGKSNQGLVRSKSQKSLKSQRSLKSQKSLKSKTQAPRRKPTAASRIVARKPTRRWGISENVADLFSMRMFQKIEADEVITPVQIQAFKVRKMSLALAEEQEREKERSRASLESMLQENDRSSVGSSISPQTPPSIDSPSSLQIINDEPQWTPPDFAPATSTREDLSSQLADDESVFTFLEDCTPSECATPLLPPQVELSDLPLPSPPPPTPPAKNPRRSLNPQRKLVPLLCPLPEDAEATVAVSTPRSSSTEANGDFVYLPSTPCTLTAPRFRHGPIRVSRLAATQDGIMGFEDGFDWTAFQMAIQGGAGDWYSENEETTRRREADEVKDVVSWWMTWNFESAGELISSGRSGVESTQASSGGSRTSMNSDNTESPASLSDGSDDEDDELSDDLAAYSLAPSNLYSAHHKWRLPTNTTPIEQGLEVDTSKQMPIIEDGIQVVQDPSSDDVDFVPMGCNLTSDLGDFLRWEAEHAYSGNFYSGPTR